MHYTVISVAICFHTYTLHKVYVLLCGAVVHRSTTTDRDQDWGLGGPTPDQCVCGCVQFMHNQSEKKGGGLPLKPLIVPAAEAFIPNGDALRNTCPPCAVGLRAHKPLFFRQPSTAAVAALFLVMEVFFHTIPISYTHISLYM